jgi:malonate transporter
MSVFLISLPIFLIIFLGWLLKKYKVVTEEWIHILNNFAYYVSLPALIIASFWEINFLDQKSWQIIGWSLSGIISFSLIIFALLSILKVNKKLKATILLGSTVGNTIYIGFPLIEIGFGKDYLPAAALIGSIFLIIPLLIVISLIQYRYCREDCLKKELIGFLRNPLVISVFAGALLSFLKFDYSLLISIKRAVVALGATASPVALFTLGGFLYGRFLKKDTGWALLISFLKLIAFPLIIVCGFLLILDGNAALIMSPTIEILILLSSMPVAVTTFVIAERFNLNKSVISSALLISTVASFIIAPLIIFLFS